MKKTTQKVMVCVSVLTFLLTAGFAQAAVWSGGGADNLWTTPGNWSPAVPGFADQATINDANGSTAPLVEAGMDITVARVELCLDGGTPATLNMTGGSIHDAGQYPFTVGSKPAGGLGTFNLSGGSVVAEDGFLISNSTGSAGVVTMSGGTLDVNANFFPVGWYSIFGIGDAGAGALNLSGGEITANKVLIPARPGGEGFLNMTGGSIVSDEGFFVGGGGTGNVHLDGGTVDTPGLVVNDGSSMDITEGVIVQHGDRKAQTDLYIVSGLITGYGGDGTVHNEYDPETDLTTVWATLAGLLGDVNLDGEVNGLDVAPFVAHVTAGTYQAEADMNGDDAVNGLDVDPFVAAVVVGGGGAMAAVPEPSTLILLGIGAIGLLLRRRRQRRI